MHMQDPWKQRTTAYLDKNLYDCYVVHGSLLPVHQIVNCNLLVVCSDLNSVDMTLARLGLLKNYHVDGNFHTMVVVDWDRMYFTLSQRIVHSIVAAVARIVV